MYVFFLILKHSFFVAGLFQNATQIGTSQGIGFLQYWKSKLTFKSYREINYFCKIVELEINT